MRTGTHRNNKSNSNPFVNTMQTQLQSRPWAEPTEAIASSSEAPEIQKEPFDRERFGHDLANIPIFAPAQETESADLPPIQTKFNDFITDSHPGAIAYSSEAPELQKEPEDRERFGHNLANIPIFAPAPPPESADLPPIQTVKRFVQQHENLQPSMLAKSIPNPKNVVQRTYLDNGQKVTDDAFQTIIEGVEVISFANRHTILGLLKNKGGAKEMNTVLLEPIEMQLVANDAYDCAWSDDKGRLSVTDGTTFTSCGITWGIDTRPNSDPPSMHVYPTEGGDKTIEIGDLIAPLKAFLGKLKKGESIKEATEYAVDLSKKLNRDAKKLEKVITALQNMGEI